VCSISLQGDQYRVDIEHQTVAGTDLLISQTIDLLDTSLERQELIAVINSGISLHGADIVARWRERTTPYPEGLAKKIIKQQMVGKRGIGAQLTRQAEHLSRGDWLCLIDERY
jgi:hypothetical protein